MLLAWGLICHHLEIHSVVALFKTCTLLRSLSSQSSLWAALLKRDYPEHYPHAEISEREPWYKDLHRYGAYYLLQSKLILYPKTALYVVREVNVRDHEIEDAARYNVLTHRTRQGDIKKCCEFLRFPFQRWIDIVEETKFNDKYPGLLNTLSCPEVSSFTYKGLNYVFIHQSESVQTVGTYLLYKLETSRWDKTIAFIHKYFSVIQIYFKEHDIRFIGLLRKGVTMTRPSDDMSIHIEFPYREMSVSKYVLFERLDGMGVKIYLYNQHSRDDFFVLVDEEPIPGWN